MSKVQNIYVARADGTVDPFRFASLAAAKMHADMLYRAGNIAVLVVTAATRADAVVKADRCYRGEITSAQARRP